MKMRIVLDSRRFSKACRKLRLGFWRLRGLLMPEVRQSRMRAINSAVFDNYIAKHSSARTRLSREQTGQKISILVLFEAPETTSPLGRVHPPRWLCAYMTYPGEIAAFDLAELKSACARTSLNIQQGLEQIG